MDLSKLVGEVINFEFLDYFYVLSDKKMDPLKEEIENFIFVKKVAGDDAQTLLQFISIRSKKDEIEKAVKNKGYEIKEFENVEENNERIAIDFSVIEKSYFTFIDTYLLETYDLMLSVKLTKLYVDSVLQYGLPNAYIFMAYAEKTQESFVKKWRSVLKTIDYGDRIVDYKEFEDRVAYCSLENTYKAIDN